VSISFLYPFIELLTATMLIALFIYVPEQYFFAYALFFSALIVVIRSDLESMLISRFTSLYLVPLGWIFAYYNMIPLSFLQSFTYSIGSFLFLSTTSWLFFTITHKQGLGQGDTDLFALIGSFTGVIGCWFTLLFASTIGSLFGIFYLLYTKQQINTRIPFGPFLSISAMIYVLYAPTIISWLLGS
jgi:leader peptidase (prepilin peptidase)/N-methyltransferase